MTDTQSHTLPGVDRRQSVKSVDHLGSLAVKGAPAKSDENLHLVSIAPSPMARSPPREVIFNKITHVVIFLIIYKIWTLSIFFLISTHVVIYGGTVRTLSY